MTGCGSGATSILAGFAAYAEKYRCESKSGRAFSLPLCAGCKHLVEKRQVRSGLKSKRFALRAIKSPIRTL